MPEIDPCMYGTLLYEHRGMADQWGKNEII